MLVYIVWTKTVTKGLFKCDFIKFRGVLNPPPPDHQKSSSGQPSTPSKNHLLVQSSSLWVFWPPPPPHHLIIKKLSSGQPPTPSKNHLLGQSTPPHFIFIINSLQKINCTQLFDTRLNWKWRLNLNIIMIWLKCVKTLQNTLVVVFCCLELYIIDDSFYIFPSFASHCGGLDELKWRLTLHSNPLYFSL